jgi:hypothetical protein
LIDTLAVDERNHRSTVHCNHGERLTERQNGNWHPLWYNIIVATIPVHAVAAGVTHTRTVMHGSKSHGWRDGDGDDSLRHQSQKLKRYQFGKRSKIFKVAFKERIKSKPSSRSKPQNNSRQQDNENENIIL